MTTTTYYNLNIVEGTDIVNPLTVDNPNYEKIDEAMHDNAVAGVTLATEIANDTVHAITRENSECAVIRFIATSEWKAGDTATVDGVPVTALLPSGKTLPDGAYVINANVFCILTGTNLTIYAEKNKAENANEIPFNDTTVGAELVKLNIDITEVNSSLSEVNNDISEINSNLSRYNVDTDSLDIYVNGKIVGSLYCGFQALSALIPTMTSATTPSGEVITNSEFSADNHYAWHAFDGDDNTYWTPNGESALGYVGYHFTKPVTARQAKVKFYNQAGTVVFQASNDGSTWTDLAAVVNPVSKQETTIDLQNSTGYSYYRANITSKTTWGGIYSMQLYGRESF